MLSNYIMLNFSAISFYVLGLIFTAFRFIIRISLKIWYLGRHQVVPPIEDPILLKSAVALAACIREGTITSEEVINAYCKRMREVNPYINAVSEPRFDEAIREAKEIDKRLQTHSKTMEEIRNETPLLGVPFTAKLLFRVQGMSCNAGCRILKNSYSDSDAEAIAQLKKAGAIFLALTNSPPFGLSYETSNRLYGLTCNPYCTTRTAGGSTGGEASLIGAGGSIIGLGNDLGGSIRHPCNFNGIFGHKPTHGTTPLKGLFPEIPEGTVEKLSATGPLCRYVEDLILVTKLMSSNSISSTLDRKVDFSKMKLYYTIDVDGNPLSKKISPEIKSVISDAADYFKSTYGTTTTKITLQELRTTVFTYLYTLHTSFKNNSISTILAVGEGDVNPKMEFLKKFTVGSDFPLFALTALNFKNIPALFGYVCEREIQGYVEKVQYKMEELLDDNSVLFLPTFPVEAHYHHELFPFLAPCVSYMLLFNLLGFPVTQCPIRLSKSKLPLGFQVVGAREKDYLTLSFASELEKAFGGWIPPNSIRIG